MNPLGNTWNYTYDGLRNRIERADANGDSTQYAYYPDNQLRRIDGRRYWNLSLGSHTGPVTATVSGKRKITYDIKGDTVNIAHRMQGVGDSGKNLISIMTYELIKEFFVCDYYGRIPVKYKGDLEMFLVKGIRPDYSMKERGVMPNELFNTKFKLRQFTDIQDGMIAFELAQMKNDPGIIPRDRGIDQQEIFRFQMNKTL